MRSMVTDFWGPSPSVSPYFLHGIPKHRSIVIEIQGPCASVNSPYFLHGTVANFSVSYALLPNVQDEPTPYEFYIDETEIRGTLEETLEQLNHQDTEKVLQIVYQPQAKFKVQAVTRCSSSMPGHMEAVIAVSFSPDGRYTVGELSGVDLYEQLGKASVLMLVPTSCWSLLGITCRLTLRVLIIVVNLAIKLNSNC